MRSAFSDPKVNCCSALKNVRLLDMALDAFSENLATVQGFCLGNWTENVRRALIKVLGWRRLLYIYMWVGKLEPEVTQSPKWLSCSLSN